MSVGTVGLGNHQNNYMYGTVRKNERGSANFASSMHNVASTINLNWTNQDTGEKALTSVGFPGGGGASVFKSKNYSEANPEYRIKYWEDEMEAGEYMVNPQTVNPMKANYLEMLAFTTYSDKMGHTSDGFGDFVSAARGINGDISYDVSNIMTRMNFKSMVTDFMDAQYNAGNYGGYMSLKRLSDYMDRAKYDVNLGNYDLISDMTHNDKTSGSIDASEFREVEIANYKFVPVTNVGNGAIRVYVNGENAGLFLAEDLKIRVDKQTGTRLLIGDMNELGSDLYDAIPVNAELERGLAEAIGKDIIPEVPLEGYYIGTHAETGIKYVMKPGEEGKGGKVLLCSAAEEARYKALGKEYMRRYPNLIKNEWEGLFYASNEIRGMSHQAANGIVNTHYDCISYNDNYDQTKNWSAKIDKKTWDLLLGWFSKNMLDSKEISGFKYWDKIFGDIGGSYERIWSDDEIKQGYLYQ